MFSEDNMKQVELATEAIDNYISCREKSLFRKDYLRELCNCISIGLSIWCGHTYIGEKKDPKELMFYQGFFNELVMLIWKMERCYTQLDKLEVKFLESVKYRGIIYRYLGSSDHNNRDKVYPIPQNDYVSWTKDKDKIYPYISERLYGPITLSKMASITDIIFYYKNKTDCRQLTRRRTYRSLSVH